MLAIVPPCRIFKRFWRYVSISSLACESWDLFVSFLNSYRVLPMDMEIKRNLARAGSNDT